MVEALADGPKTPTDLTRLTGLYRSNVSRGLRQLADAGIVFCLTPERRKGRFYALGPGATIGLRVWDRAEEFPSQKARPRVRVDFTPMARGEALQSGVAAALDLLGSDGLLALSRACGYNLLSFQPDEWYSMEIHHTFLREVRNLRPSGGLELCRQLGRRSISHLPFLQKFLASEEVDLQALGKRTPLAHDYYFNFGRFEFRPRANGFELRQFDMLPTPEWCAARRGNYEGVMLALRIRPDVRELTCETDGDPFCSFALVANRLLESSASFAEAHRQQRRA